ncbi:unnamed protein product [Symbiodinium natans]|uniref:Uncharacterized protein n=1 Tax=Symbiodinium natans TaxID=878477 RepID=A0A812L5H5_9DINO|nr:unnamed protein product [Symbiodinium natans]
MAATRRSAFSLVLAWALALLALRASVNFVAWAGAPVAPRSSVALRASIMAKEETGTKRGTKTSTPQAGQFKYPSQLTGLSPEEIQARKARALDIWESLKPDVEAEMSRYQTFRPDKFEEFMRADSRGRGADCHSEYFLGSRRATMDPA